MRILRPALAAVLLLSLTAFSQQAPAEIAASREQILKLFEVMHIRQQMRVMMQGMAKQQSALVRDSIKQRYPQITEDEMMHLSDFMVDTMKDFPVDGMLDDMIPVYQKHLTQPDVEAMIAFYSSPTGQKLMQEMPAMTSEGMQAAYPRMQREMEQVMQRVEERMKQKPEPKKESAPKAPSSQSRGNSST
ncbi:MAG TPA: DUF2059 domain-containing protein [Terriglobales bacterium]|nr:DUF2059 domain-containing protein [Terriglobales bacterium]